MSAELEAGRQSCGLRAEWAASLHSRRSKQAGRRFAAERVGPADYIATGGDRLELLLGFGVIKLLRALLEGRTDGQVHERMISILDVSLLRMCCSNTHAAFLTFKNGGIAPTPRPDPLQKQTRPQVVTSTGG